MYLLILYVEKTNDVITRFIESMNDGDYTQVYSFPEGKSFLELKKVYARTMNTLRNFSIDKERHNQYLQMIVQSIDIGILVFKENKEVDLINNAFRKIFGISGLNNIDEMESVDRNIFDLFINSKNGKKELIKLNRGNELMQLIVCVTDFILLREKYRLITLQNIHRELEENEMDAWQKLTRVLTHEIMNSIAPISSLASTANNMLNKLFKDTKLTENTGIDTFDDILQALHSIEKRSLGLLNFVENYRKFLRIPKPVFKIVVCKDLLSRVKNYMHGITEEKKINFQTQVKPDNMEIIADLDLIEQVLINLVKNSIESLENIKRPFIEIKAFNDAMDRPNIEITDNGHGINEEIIEKIFIPFFTTKSEGSGVGLSLCRQIMRLHNGAITVRSVPLKTTTFYLKF